MKRLLFLLTFLLFSVPSFAATGDITKAVICGTDSQSDPRINTWVIELSISGAVTSGTTPGTSYTMGFGSGNNPTTAKVVVTLTSNGFDSSGNVTTRTRTLYGTQYVRQPTPNDNKADEITTGNAGCDGVNIAASTTAVRVALSDFVYSTDSSITVTAAAAFYTDTNSLANNAVTGLSVTNSISSITSAAGTLPIIKSTGAFPTPIARWGTVPYRQITTSTMPLEVVCFSRFHLLSNTNPCAAVTFTVTDQHSNTVTQTVSTVTKSTSPDVNPVLVYLASIDLTTLTQGDTLTCNFKAYPWYGDSSSYVDTSVTTGTIVKTVKNAAGGTLYTANDILTISGGSGNAIIKVITANATGVLTYEILYGGTGYATATSVATTDVTNGLATGFTVNTTVQAGVAGNEELGPLVMLNDKTGAYGMPAAVVDPTNGHNSVADTWFYSSISAAETAYSGGNTNSYDTPAHAVAACKTYNNDASPTNPHSWPTRNNLDGCQIRMATGASYAVPNLSDQGAQNVWLTFAPTTGTAASAVTFSTGTNQGFGVRLGHFYNLTVSGSSTGQISGLGSNNNRVWVDTDVINLTGTAPIYSNQATYATWNSVTAMNGGFHNFSSTRSGWALIRGNTGPATAINADWYAVIGNTQFSPFMIEAQPAAAVTTVTVSLSGQQLSDGGMYAFNTVYALTVGYAQWYATASTMNVGVAVVQNIVEKTTGVDPLWIFSGDTNNCTTFNVLFQYNTFPGQRENFAYNDGTSSLGLAQSFYHTQWSVVGNLFGSSMNTKTDTFATANAGRIGNWANHYQVGYGGNRYSGGGANGLGTGPNTWLGMFAGLYENANNQQVSGSDSNSYIAILSHTSGATNHPVSCSGAPGCWNTDWVQRGQTGGGAYTVWTTATVYDPLLFASDKSYSSGNAAGNGTYTFSSKTSSAIGVMPHSYDLLQYDIAGTARNGSAGAYEGNPLTAGGGGNLTTLGAGDRIYRKDWRR